MTPFETELDKLLQSLSSEIAINNTTSLNGYRKRRNIDDVAVRQTKKAIKQAVIAHIINYLIDKSYYVPDIETDVIDLSKAMAVRRTLGDISHEA